MLSDIKKVMWSNMEGKPLTGVSQQWQQVLMGNAGPLNQNLHFN